MTQGSPIRLIFAVALPLMLGNVFQQMYTVIDAGIVGKNLGVNALAALGVSDWFNWLFLSAVQGLAQGFVVPMAQAFGAKDYPALRKNAGHAAVLSIFTGLLITVIAQIAIRPTLDLMGTPLLIRPMSVSYLTVLFAGLPVVMGFNLLSGILRALGNGKSPLIAMIIGSIVNIALDFLFVSGFGWGVDSAAAATVIAQFSSFLYCLLRLASIDFIRPSRNDLHLTRPMTTRLLRLGIPIMLQNAIIAIGGMILQTVVNGLGVTFIAAYTATNKLFGILETAGISFGYAMITYSGQNLGAGKLERIRRGTRNGTILSVLASLTIGFVIISAGRFLLSGFIDMKAGDAAQVLDIAYEYLWFTCAALPALYILHIYRSTLQGIGNSAIPMYSGIAEFIMRVGCAILLPGFISYRGIFVAEILAWFGADLMLVAGYFRVYQKLCSGFSEKSS
ncbi:MAG: MATE family efflux transporter [Christensenellales bacterium]|nr:MATE family efflux transporter [Christensenellales bacterium]